jgi:hypothetical protein
MVMEYRPNSTSTVDTVIGPAHQGNLFVAADMLAKPYSLSIATEKPGLHNPTCVGVYGIRKSRFVNPFFRAARA